MKLFPINRDTIALAFVGIVVFVFFVAGLFKVLDYFIVKVFLFTSFGSVVIVAISYAIKNDIKKNRPEDKLQDDSY